MEKNKKCPCCGKDTLNPKYSGFEICNNCGWQDDGYQEDHPDVGNCANIMSLNEAKKAYKEGKKVY